MLAEWSLKKRNSFKIEEMKEKKTLATLSKSSWTVYCQPLGQEKEFYFYPFSIAMKAVPSLVLELDDGPVNVPVFSSKISYFTQGSLL